MVFAFAPPSVLELGNATGFDLFLQDQAGVGHEVLLQARNKFLMLAAQNPALQRVRPNGMSDEPQYKLEIDDEKASALGVSSPTSTAPCPSPGVPATSTTSSTVAGSSGSTCRAGRTRG